MERQKKTDFKGLGAKLDDFIEKIIERDYGLYAISDEQRELFAIIENMFFFQRRFNKGVRLVGSNGKEDQVEIYNLHKEINRFKKIGGLTNDRRPFN